MPKRYTPSQKHKRLKEARKKLSQGWSNHRTAKHVGVNDKTLKRWLDEPVDEAAKAGARVHKAMEEYLHGKCDGTSCKDCEEMHEKMKAFQQSGPGVSVGCFGKSDGGPGKGEDAFVKLRNPINVEIKPELSRKEVEELCEEYNELRKAVPDMECFIDWSKDADPETVGRYNAGKIAEKSRRKRMAEIRDQIGQDTLDEYREKKEQQEERKYWNKRTAQNEREIDYIKGFLKNQTSANFYVGLWLGVLTVAAVFQWLA